MKYLLITCLLFIGLNFVKAQNGQNFHPHQELSISQGIFPVIPSLFDGWFDTDISFSVSNDYSSALYKKGAFVVTGATAVHYMYNKYKWLSYGASISYYGAYEKTFDRFTDKLVGRDYNQCLNVMALLRFTYLNREYVRLYGKVGLGIGVNWETDEFEDLDLSRTNLFLPINLTLFGIQVGKKIYGFGEYGISANGMFLAGIGCKF